MASITQEQMVEAAKKRFPDLSDAELSSLVQAAMGVATESHWPPGGMTPIRAVDIASHRMSLRYF